MSTMLALAIVGCGHEPTPPSAALATHFDKPFPDADFLWAEIEPDPRIDASSADIIGALVAGRDTASALLKEYAIPIVVADASDPVVTVSCRDQRDDVCEVEQDSEVRLPTDGSPNAGSDGALVVLDTTRDVSYELWRATRIDGRAWSVEWGTINDLAGDGISDNGGSGSGLSRLAGVVRVAELKAGRIEHALAVASSATCASSFRSPAWSTDGINDDPDCLPMGSRLQLDPDLDLDVLDLTDGERLLASTLQRYGAIVVDSSATPLAFFFEYEPPADPNAELGPSAISLGFRWDFDPLTGIPWADLRLLAE